MEWLGEVPQHWPVYSLKRTVDGCVNGLWGDEPDGENDIAVIRVADFERSFSTVGLDKLTYRSITPKERQSRLIKSGDLLIEKSGGGEKTLVGCVVLFTHEFDAITSNFVARMRPLAEFDSQFLCYAFGNLYHGRVNYPSVKQVTGIQNLDAESYLQERFCFPARVEQTQIARFLDHETARIDALIEEQQRLIELLKEKRQAVISHAVTKGLDPTVPMKDSGVEWLGEVPAHWACGALARVADRVVVGIAEAATHAYAEQGVPILRATNIRPGKIIGELLYVNDDFADGLGSKLMRAGDLVTVRTGNAGVTAVVPEDLDGCQCFTMLITTLSKSGDSEYYCLLLNSHYAKTYFNLEGWGTAQVNISVPILKWLPVPIPPLDEQQEISKYLRGEMLKIDALIDSASEVSGLLSERRSALISAAVTGKIDVRGWQPTASIQVPEPAVAEAN
ncbi:restriction endonuclease subunit S [Pseudomonas sp. TTU2014-105ASC]|nr:restriction endonuclease subunit S [Pseudomonas sp. TTU2014-105ASC]